MGTTPAADEDGAESASTEGANGATGGAELDPAAGDRGATTSDVIAAGAGATGVEDETTRAGVEVTAASATALGVQARWGTTTDELAPCGTRTSAAAASRISSATPSNSSCGVAL